MRYIQATCRICRSSIKLDIGDMSEMQALAALRRREGFNCSAGMHVELGEMTDYLDIEPGVHQTAEPPDDRAFLAELRARFPDNDIYVLGADEKCREVGLSSFHEVKGLEHVGFGDFTSPRADYVRRDSPRGTRFMVAISKNAIRS